MAIKIERWIDKSGIDYYVSFIKAWIPFNAWYMSEYYDEDLKITTDKAIIEKIKNESNLFKDKIISLVNSNSKEALEFKMNIYHLQKSLELHPFSKGQPYSFANICVSDNTNCNVTFTSHGKTYKGVYDKSKPKGSNRFSVEAMRKSGSTIVKIEIQNCKEETLTAHPDYAKCCETDKSNLKKCLDAIFPKKTISIISKNARNRLHIHDDLFFVNDTKLIAKAIISMFYELRCKLFHGELDPSESNSLIYCHAYHMLYSLVKELK